MIRFNRPYRSRRGVAMIIVLVFVAIAVILSFAILSSQSVMTQSSGNGTKGAQADALADSGVQLALYYLQNPAAAPVLNAAGYYPGQIGISLGSNASGTVDITVTQQDSSTYVISSVGHVTGAGTTSSRTSNAKASINYAYVPTDAADINGGMNVYSNMTVNGSIHASGNVVLSAGAKVNGTITAPSVTGSLLNLLGSIITLATKDCTPPVQANMTDFRTYTYLGKTYSAQKISYTATTLGPTTNNPLGVYYDTGDVTLSQSLTINGTLLVPDGKLTIKNSLTVNAQTGMPALELKSDMQFGGSKRTVVFNGLSWIGGTITKSGTTTNNSLTFNGSVQFAGSNAVDKNYNGTVVFNFDKTKATTNNFTGASGALSPASVSLISFSN